jgi:hypothetical protein
VIATDLHGCGETVIPQNGHNKHIMAHERLTWWARSVRLKLPWGARSWRSRRWLVVTGFSSSHFALDSNYGQGRDLAGLHLLQPMLTIPTVYTEELAVYVRAYSAPGALRGAWLFGAEIFAILAELASWSGKSLEVSRRRRNESSSHERLRRRRPA